MNKLAITDNILSYEIDPENKWSLEIDKIKFIGEYTTSAGPMADDWFFVFADSVDQWWQVPALAVDHNNFWTDIGKKLDSEIAPNLFASTSWATSIIYPKSLEKQELFVVVKTEEEKPRTFWQKLFGKGGANTKLELTDKVKQLF
ncbi:hypothetical protein [Rufibacter sp. LB8]|uniref:hypothetical protein n=1 Tax=Rufibacter sp. LB8 TaxID=2777781 RepID=UPI00178C6072|nr:hypothetical protein [Rufibacter sp. LB8]